MRPRCTWLFVFFLICVLDSIKGFSRCRGYWSILLTLMCVYICSAGYVELPIVLLYLLRCLVYHMVSKTRRNSQEFTESDSVYLSYLLRCLVYHMLFKTRRNSGSLHRVIGEVLVLGLLVVVHKIPYSICIFNTAVVLEPGTMVCALCLSYCCQSGTPQLPGTFYKKLKNVSFEYDRKLNFESCVVHEKKKKTNVKNILKTHLLHARCDTSIARATVLRGVQCVHRVRVLSKI